MKPMKKLGRIFGTTPYLIDTNDPDALDEAYSA